MTTTPTVEYRQGWGLGDAPHAVHPDAQPIRQTDVLGTFYRAECGYEVILTDSASLALGVSGRVPRFLDRAYRCRACSEKIGAEWRA